MSFSNRDKKEKEEKLAKRAELEQIAQAASEEASKPASVTATEEVKVDGDRVRTAQENRDSQIVNTGSEFKIRSSRKES